MPASTLKTDFEENDSTSWRLRCRYVWTENRGFQADATVVVEDGRLAGSGTRYPGTDAGVVDLGNAIVLPGLVNAHVHLEFSGLHEPLDRSSSFPDWIRQLIAVRTGRTGHVLEHVEQGWREAAHSGTVVLGEITTDAAGVPADRPDRPRIVSFREIIGLDPARLAAIEQTVAEHLQPASGSPAWPAGSRGLSPHAPYSVHRTILERLVAIALAERVPLAMHLAETPAELELMQHGTGALAGLLKSLGVWRTGLFPEAGFASFREYLELLAQAPAGLVIHGNCLAEADLRLLADCPQLTLVYCPRTHAGFRHARHPWRRLRELGGRVVVGTDGRGSNPDLSLWNELRFLARRHPELSASELLPLATGLVPGLHESAVVVDGNGDCGRAARSLANGQVADLTVVRLPPGAGFDPEQALLRSGARVCGSMRGGRWIVRPSFSEA